MRTQGVLKLAGLRPEDLQQPEARVRQHANDLVFDELTLRSGDPDFGLHFAERLSLDALDVLGHLAAHSANVGEALARVCALSRILHDSGRVEMELQGDSVCLYPGCRGLPHAYPRQIAEFASLATVVLLRMVTARHLVPQAVHLRHPRPANVQEHLRLFGVTPLFGQNETRVLFDASWLALPIADASPGLAGYLDANARDAIARLGDPACGLVSQLEQELGATLSRGAPDVAAVAKRLGLGARTLQRRLADEGTSFQQVVERVRLALACRYLDDPQLSLTEIAFLVGFSEPSAFHRAFKRWTGRTPSAYRAGGLAPAERPGELTPRTAR